MTTKRPTQADVARLAGVTRGTVSMVLSGKSGNLPISESTVQKVMKAVHQLGYVPNPLAQALAGGSNRLIGVFTYEAEFPYDVNNFFYEYLNGIEQGACDLDYNLLLFTRGRGSDKPRIFSGGHCVLRLADGAIIIGARPRYDEIYQLAEDEYPFVFIGRREIEGKAIDWVANDYCGGAREITHYLIAQGHHKMIVLTGSIGLESFDDKLKGVQEAVSIAGETEIKVYQIEQMETLATVQQVLAETQATAIICTEMNTLNSLYHNLEKLNIHIPNNISLVSLTDGYSELPDHLIPAHAFLNRSDVGKQAVHTLVSRLERKAQRPQEIRLPCQFIVGNTISTPRW